jgi:PAS domain S-box-containing protein
VTRPTPAAVGPRTLAELTLSVDPHAASEARLALDEIDGLDDATRETLRLLVSELVTNAVRHGPSVPGGTIDVRVEATPDTIRVEVRDRGEGFVPPGPEAVASDVGGWGLMLVRQMSRRWGIEPGAPTRVWFELARPAADDDSDAWNDGVDAVLLEAQHAAVIATDVEGTVRRWNRHAEELFGFTKAEAVGRSVLDLMVRADDTRAGDAIMRRLRSGEPWDGEWLAPRRDGSSVWVRVANAPVRDERGALVGMIGVSVDLTDRKAAESALAESEERLRIALESGRMGTWEWDVRGGDVRWSESLERIHGLEPGTFGGSFEDFQRDMHPEDRARVLGRIERALNERAPYLLDYRIVRPHDGAVRWLSVRGRVLRDDDDRPVRMVGVCSDITERKEAERALAVQYAVSRVLANTPTLEAAAPELLGAIGTALGWEIGAVWFVDDEDRTMRALRGWQAANAVGDRFLAATLGHRFERGVGLAGRVWVTGRPLWVPDFSSDRTLPRAPTALEEGLHSAFAFPITVGSGVLGAVEFLSRRIREPDEALLELMTSIGGQIGQFLERTITESELAASEARKTAVFEAALEAIITMDERGVVVELNAAAAEMFGYDRDAVIGREVAEIFVPPSLREQHRAALERYRRTGRGQVLGRRLELTGMRADGSEFPIELTITRVDLPDADLFTGYVRDITPRRRAEELQAKLFESERAAREQVERAHERVAFLADASAVLGATLDPAETMGRLTSLVVPRLADWCAVDVVEPDGSLEAIAVTHGDPDRVELARAYRRRWPMRVDDGGAVARVLETGRPFALDVVTDEMIRESVPDPERRAIVEELGLRSIMVVPLVARGRALGAITFASSESARAFGADDLQLAEDLARRAALAYDNATLYEERSHIARTLQRTLLPRALPEIDGVEVAAFYQPSSISHADVGGDFYDVFGAGEGTWNIVIGDVCGKGVEAAALTGMARHTLRGSVTRDAAPIEALENLNRVMLREDGERFCTVAFGRLTRQEDEHRLEVACGGHPAPLVVRADGTVEAVGAPGSLLGVFEDVAFEHRATSLRRGDLVVFFTDGLVDVRASDALDESALRSLVARCAGRTADEVLEEISRAVSDPDQRTSDDTCVLVLRVTA